MAVITGTDGNDMLLGTPENDQISGLGGNDTLDGSTGADTLTGGVGSDAFVLRADQKPGDDDDGDDEFDFYEDFIADFTAAEGDVFVLPTLPNGTQVTFDMLKFELESEEGITGTEIEVPFNGEFEEIALVANVTPDQLNNPALFVPTA